MQTSKITKEDIAEISVSALPTRPTSDRIYGGKGYSSTEMKAAFDRLPMYIIDAFNRLVDDITAEGDESLAASIPTGISDGHSLYNIFQDIKNGNFASYITIDGEPLTVILARLSERCGL